MAAGGNQSIGTRALWGLVWAYGSYVGGRLLVLVSTVILARLLSPEDFGVVALALVFIELLQMIRDLGVTQALIVIPDEKLETHADTAFTFSVVVGFVLTVAVAGLGPVAAGFFGEDELKALLPVLGLVFFLNSFGITHFALAQRKLDFRTRTASELSDVVIRGAASVGFALAGFGAWSLVLGYVIGSLTHTLVLWVLVPWRPTRRARRSDLKDLVAFGGQVTGIDLTSAYIQNVDYIFIGKVLGTAPLGLYTIAWRLPELLVKNFANVAGQVLFPAFAAVGKSGVGDAFLVAYRYTAMLTLPLACGLALLADPLVAALFGEKWAGAVASMQVLALYSVMIAVSMPPGVAYKAVRRADVLLKLALLRAAVVTAAIAVFVSEGILAVALCQAGVAVVFHAVDLVVANRLLSARPGQIWRAVMPPLVATGGLAAVLAPIARFVEEPWLALGFGAPAGAAAYLGLLYVLAPDAVRDLRERVAARRGSPDPAVTA